MEGPRGGPGQVSRAVAWWARSHLALWIVVAAAVDAALLALVTVLIALPGQSDATISGLILALLVLLTGSVVFPVAGHLVEGRGQAAEQEEDRRERIDRQLARGSLARLPQLSELADDVLGATPTRYSIGKAAPYVARPEADENIRGLLAAPGPPYPFVIVWGTTKAGKSRTLTEALRAAFDHDPVVIVPRDGQALAELARLGIGNRVGHRPAVVVLDDLGPAGLEALTADVLDVAGGWAVIAATMTAQRRQDALKTGSEVGAVARTALEHRSCQYELASGPPEGAEKAEAERLYPGEHFDGSIAETLVGGRELIARYKASHDSDPAGCAIVRAAIDVRRAGLSRPVTEAELRRLFPLYLHAVRIGLLPTTEQFTAGIQWAARPVASQVALLRPASPAREPPAWIIFDHAVTADEGHEGHHPRPVPAETWAELIAVLPPQDTFAVGIAAYTSHETTAAVTAFRKATISGHADQAPMAAVNLGVLLSEQGDAEGARAAYQQAIDSSHADQAPMAAVNLGILLKQQDDAEGARAAYQQAIDSSHADQAPKAAYNLGILLKQQDDAEGARAAYQQAIDSSHAYFAPTAAYGLGILLKQQDEAEGARAAYQQAIDSGHADQAPKAAVGLGILLGEQGDAEGARAAYQQAIDSSHAYFAPAAAVGLGALLGEQGDAEGARAAYQQAIDSSHAHAAPAAAVGLGILLGEQDDPEGARAAYQQAIDSGHADAAPAARRLLDELGWNHLP